MKNRKTIALFGIVLYNVGGLLQYLLLSNEKEHNYGDFEAGNCWDDGI